MKKVTTKFHQDRDVSLKAINNAAIQSTQRNNPIPCQDGFLLLCAVCVWERVLLCDTVRSEWEGFGVWGLNLFLYTLTWEMNVSVLVGDSVQLWRVHRVQLSIHTASRRQPNNIWKWIQPTAWSVISRPVLSYSYELNGLVRDIDPHPMRGGGSVGAISLRCCGPGWGRLCVADVNMINT